LITGQLAKRGWNKNPNHMSIRPVGRGPGELI
jgi:hypothetical protein